MNRTIIIAAITIALLVLCNGALAGRYTTSIDGKPLQSIFVYVPEDHKNIPITELSFAELDTVTTSTPGRQWNDMVALCDSIYLIHGRYTRGCEIQTTSAIIRPVTARAMASFTILPAPMPATPPSVLPTKTIMSIDPVYPPWSPTYDPYW